MNNSDIASTISNKQKLIWVLVYIGIFAYVGILATLDFFNAFLFWLISMLIFAVVIMVVKLWIDWKEETNPNKLLLPQKRQITNTKSKEVDVPIKLTFEVVCNDCLQADYDAIWQIDVEYDNQLSEHREVKTFVIDITDHLEDGCVLGQKVV